MRQGRIMLFFLENVANIDIGFAGIGWTNMEGTVGKEYIPKNATVQTLQQYKKVQFPDTCKPDPPTMASRTHTSVTLTATEGFQYKCGYGEWQDSPTFTGLTEDTEYTFYQRMKGDANFNESQSSVGTIIRTKQEPVSYTEISEDGYSMTFVVVEDYIKAVPSNETVWLKDCFYVVKEKVVLKNGLVYSGDVTFIVFDNAELIVYGGFLHDGSKLKIYGQSGQSGQINVIGQSSTLNNVPDWGNAQTYLRQVYSMAAKSLSMAESSM